MTSVHLKGIRKAYDRAVAVEEVSLDIPSGSLFFLLGASGCGKTTILRMIAGFVQPTAGRIRFGDRDVTDLPPERRNTGMVFQNYALWPHMTVAQNVGFGLEVRGITSDERKQRIGEALDLVRMGEYAERVPNQLSGGQQQRVALARALAFRPDLLLLDEPLSNLDAKLRLEMRTEIRRISAELRITMVYVTHDQHEALSLADQVAVMFRGRIEQLGAPRAIYQKPRTRFVAEFIGETNFVTAHLRSAVGADGCADVESALGSWRASVPASARDGSEILLSIRPESIRVTNASQGGAGVRGKCTESTYLGSHAQHVVEVSGTKLKVLEANPHGPSLQGREVAVQIDADQVVGVEA